MSIQYVEPLQAAYGRMVKILFQPFDLAKWMVLGFGAWLATLLDGGLFFPGGGSSDAGVLTDIGEITNAGDEATGCIILAVALIVLVVIPLVIALLWVESRAEFVFLDDVVHDRALIQQPWREFGPLGNSLFLWRLAFGAAVLLLIVAMISPIFFLLDSGPFTLDAIPVALVVLIALLVVGLAIVAGLIGFFLDGFVVPLMYRFRLTTTAAWRRFLPLLRANAGAFIVYALFVLVLHFGVAFGVLALMLLTCCIAAIPLIVPYIGTVVLLPIVVFFRLYSLEFLGQFDPALRLLPEPLPVPAMPGAEPPPQVGPTA